MATRDIVFIALFAALMAALGLFPPLMIPGLGIPITAQSMGPMLIGGILGARRGFFSMLLFLALVAVGLPLLSGGRGGLASLVGPWSGFIFGWALAALVIGFMVKRVWSRLDFVRAFAISVLGGIGVVYGVGIPWYSAMSGMGLVEAFTGSMIAFIPGDLIKAGIAAAVIVAVKRAYPLITPQLSRSRA
ncbi:MAG: biotin transporter BioY [Pseudomonadota bacterium]|nr:biotin transporter BioY [Pseudomonadota bacterium]